MDFYEINPKTVDFKSSLKKTNFCYLPTEIDPSLIESNMDLVITPIVGFTKDRFRIGFGGGYYDRFFERLTSRLQLESENYSFDSIFKETTGLSLLDPKVMSTYRFT